MGEADGTCEMLSYIGRSGHLAPAIKATSQAVANGSKNIIPGVVEAAAAPLVQPSPLALTASAMAQRCATGPVRARAGVAGKAGPCWPPCTTPSWRGGAGRRGAGCCCRCRQLIGGSHIVQGSVVIIIYFLPAAGPPGTLLPVVFRQRNSQRIL